jgi:hypothetical protein
MSLKKSAGPRQIVESAPFPPQPPISPEIPPKELSNKPKVLC